MGLLQDIRQYSTQSDLIDADSIIEKLVQHFGGRDLYIPSRSRKGKGEEKLKKYLGDSIFVFLCTNLGGQRFYVPKKSDCLTERNKRIKEEYYEGHTSSSLAKKYGLSERRIIGIVNAKQIENRDRIARRNQRRA